MKAAFEADRDLLDEFMSETLRQYECSPTSVLADKLIVKEYVAVTAGVEKSCDIGRRRANRKMAVSLFHRIFTFWAAPERHDYHLRA
jgi:hypothetical protein